MRGTDRISEPAPLFCVTHILARTRLASTQDAAPLTEPLNTGEPCRGFFTETTSPKVPTHPVRHSPLTRVSCVETKDGFVDGTGEAACHLPGAQHPFAAHWPYKSLSDTQIDRIRFLPSFPSGLTPRTNIAQHSQQS